MHRDFRPDLRQLHNVRARGVRDRRLHRDYRPDLRQLYDMRAGAIRGERLQPNGRYAVPRLRCKLCDVFRSWCK